MKLASYRIGEKVRFGVWLGDAMLDLYQIEALLPQAAPWPRTAIELIEGGPQLWQRAQQIIQALVTHPQARRIPEGEIEWLPPVLTPSKIVCVAFNNSANTGRIMRGPKHPALFTKPASALIGHQGLIECRREYGRVHPEPELAAVIGRRAKGVSAESAYDYVFGYTIHNDITSPTMRDEDTFHYRAIHPKDGNHREIEYVESWVSYPGRYKGADTFACLGPWIVSRDEIPDPHTLTVTCRHQGALITEDNTENFYYRLPQLLEFVSRYMTLEPGDILSMGTALKKSSQGGAVQNIDLNRLGGPISVSIERIGTLNNGVTHLD